ncbi:MAG: chromosome segregation protein SMC [Candidatus Sumerlaeia bacterium]
MFLKKIEMVGFKSFARRTALHFHPGATIVVGPNGCGKSNVLDAMRWVLGSQSAKGLRGDKMQDVVFAGSKTEKPTAFAQVSLTINNERGILPIDVSEVEIGRRLFRTGESEYLINRQPCRLRDIHELFLDTGGGAHSYAIMEQGRVGEIVNMKPVDRMSLFEEAAGVAKYKVRREETMRKLQRTEADLLRLNDLIFEVEGQVAALKRQAQKAEQYNKLTAEVQQIEKRLMAARYRKLKDGFSGLHARQRELSDRKAALAAELARLEAAAVREQTAAAAAAGTLQEKRERRFELARQIERLRHEVSLSAERQHHAAARREQLAGEIAALLAERDELQRRREDLMSVAGAVEKELETLGRRQADLKEALDQERARHGSVVEQLSALRRDIADRQARRIEAGNQARFAAAMLERLNEERKALEAGDKLAGRNAAAAWDELNSLRQDLQRLEHEKKEILAELDSRTAALKDLRRLLGELELRRQQLVSDLRRLESRHEVLKQAQDSFDGYFKGVKTIMKAAQSGRLQGVVGVFSNLVRIPERFELALETALGGDLQDIVMERVEDVKAAVALLKREQGGRATFLPLDHLRPAEPNEWWRCALAQEPGVVGWANELVECEPRLRLAVDFLLAGTLVVETMDAAIAIQRGGNAVRCVTLDGELFHARGKVAGGEAKLQGLLGRSRELRDLPRQIETARYNLDDTIKDAQRCEEELGRRSEELENLRQRLNLTEIEIGRAQAAARAAEERCNKIKSEQKSLHERLKQSAAEIQKAEAAMADGRRLAEQLAREAEQLEQRAVEIQQSLDAGQGQLDALTAEFNAATASLSALNERQRAVVEKMQMLDRDLQTRQAAVEAREREREQLGHDGEALADAKRRSEERLAALIGEEEELRHWIETATRKQEELGAGLRQITARVHETQRELNEATNELHDVELKISEFSTQEKLIGEQAVEKFNVPLEQVLAETEGEQDTPDDLMAALHTTRERIVRLGNVNPGALDEYNAQKQRLEFLTTQRADMEAAKSELEKTIQHIDQVSRQLFLECFEAVRAHFIQTYQRLFEGGTADLLLVSEDGPEGQPPREGVEIVAQPPGKRLKSIHLLSGGEKALTAIALMFALFLHKPAPFCILDEIDAPLDDVNVARFVRLVREFSDTTQFIIITHNKQTMELADTIYGVTMQEPGISKIVSVRFEDLEREALVS